MKAYYNGQIFTGEKILSDKCVLTENEKIIDIINADEIPTVAQKI